MKKQA